MFKWAIDLLPVGPLAATMLLSVATAEAGCEPSQDPSPPSDVSSGINFYNETQFALRVFWSDFEGFLSPQSDWVQPGEAVSFNSFVGHAWFIEVNTPEGAICAGPIRPNGPEFCQMRVLYDGGIGYDAGFCDFPG
jgi:hypothetical protein